LNPKLTNRSLARTIQTNVTPSKKVKNTRIQVMRCKIDEHISFLILILKPSNTTRKKKDKGKPGEKSFSAASAASETPSENSADQGTKNGFFFPHVIFKTLRAN
jgi:hypothetical protein